jgi:nitrite reductase/ring-hydroxylating ferredoxin subunit
MWSLATNEDLPALDQGGPRGHRRAIYGFVGGWLPARHHRVAQRRRGKTEGESIAMARCEVCGNEYDKSFEVVSGGEEHTFDSFECAIHALAARCEHCGCAIIGHGVEGDGRIFCCAHCAEVSGVSGIVDRV